MKKILELNKKVYPWLTIDLIKKGLEKLKNERVNLPNSTNLSDTTSPSCFTSTTETHIINETVASNNVVKSLLLLHSTVVITSREEE